MPIAMNINLKTAYISNILKKFIHRGKDQLNRFSFNTTFGKKGLTSKSWCMIFHQNCLHASPIQWLTLSLKIKLDILYESFHFKTFIRSTHETVILRAVWEIDNGLDFQLHPEEKSHFINLIPSMKPTISYFYIRCASKEYLIDRKSLRRSVWMYLIRKISG